MSTRVAVDKYANKNQKKQAQGKTLRYEICDPTTRSGLDESRRTEWNKWEKFAAGQIIRGELLEELRAAGHKLIPTQWIETDKAEHLRRSWGKYVPPEFESRLVGCGQFEDTIGIRTDSPTCDLEGQHDSFMVRI